ncbi:MAG TPA: TonB-dependent receptor, partial [Caldithrix abyssi]|nr:TonB-dependent receptor [Caldithrix abyssi]
MHKTFYLFLLTIFFINSLFAGTTGKIAGVVTDASTGDPLVGVNILLEGTTLGAATDVDGAYVILNIPPGLYTIVFNYIGYRTVRVKDVRVNVDFTARVDQKLKETVLEGATVEVIGERNPLVRQDLTNTQVAVTSDKIEALPVDQIRDVIALQAGVVVDNGGALHIRGGRSNEIAYQVNGLTINNPFSNSQGVGLATNAVEEVSVSAGTFSAEYGNALSGVINFVTKEGGAKYHASLKAWTGDHYSTHDDIFFNIDDIDPFNNRRVEATLGGPVPLLGKKFTFFASGVWLNDKGHLYGMRIYNP